MTKIEQAADILRALGLPTKQQNERSTLTLLTLCGLKETDDWSATSRPLLRAHLSFILYNLPIYT